MARTGRRPGNEDTRGEILDAARSAFAAFGYDRATIRGIAADAGVDPALIHHYFGSKKELFVSVVEFPVDPELVLQEVLSEGIENAGRKIARIFLTAWDAPATREPLLAVVRAAVTTDQGATLLREFITVMVLPLMDKLDGPYTKLRLQAAAGQMVGVAILRYVIQFEELKAASIDELVDLLGPRIQGYLTGE